jgi:hypothetical protein
VNGGRPPKNTLSKLSLSNSSTVLTQQREMGKKEKFIDNKNSTKFHLLHRSQRDEAHATFEVPSNFVLVQAVDV